MSRSTWVVVSVALAFVLGLTCSACAMPNFAREYSVSCQTCHTMIPRLNETGFNFRKAGFRMAEELGKAPEKSFEETFTARIQARYDTKRRDDQGTKTTSHQLTLHEVTLYPISGSFGKYYGSLTELSLLSEDFVEIENAYFRVSHVAGKGFLSARVGIMHPFEGYGASDRPYTINRPLFQRVAANHNQSTQFTPWGFDEAGLEVAYVQNRTSLSATLFNGLFVEGEEGTYKAFPAAGGSLQKMGGFSEKNSKDVQLFLNQILKEDGSGASVYYYHGAIDLPDSASLPVDEFDRSSSFGNKFDRVAVYGSWRVVPKLDLQGAFQSGKDHFFDAAKGNSDGTFTSQGWFAEADAPVHDNLTLGGRYEMFDPSTDKDKNTRTGVTLFANVPMNDGLQCIAEFQHIAQERVGKDDLKDDNFQTRLIWIW